MVVGGAALLALLVAFRQPLARLGIGALLGMVTGTRATVGEAHIGTSQIDLRDVQLARPSGPLLVAERIAATYNLRDLLPGG